MTERTEQISKEAEYLGILAGRITLFTHSIRQSFHYLVSTFIARLNESTIGTFMDFCPVSDFPHPSGNMHYENTDIFQENIRAGLLRFRLDRHQPFALIYSGLSGVLAVRQPHFLVSLNENPYTGWSGTAGLMGHVRPLVASFR